ncbi:MAG: Signal transduction histidine-protein kinase BaeS [Luteibacter sp.]|uniref:sensor histidine kinase n=1 Tax=Luteibacter sp. TaxID=1886636 RepID=UPI001380B6AD|nr:HAMP domain-containing sensor histidine kinase [Luteibacter sp.]KAF1009763.1 MAG: Signal transduction histidine-protein kinase BaeS [Luteibacter sp.]
MAEFRHSVVFRMSASYGVVLLLSVALISAVFYVGTAGLLGRNIDTQLRGTLRQLVDTRQQHGADALVRQIHALLSDDRDIDTEIYLLTDTQGRKTIGNLTAWPSAATQPDGLRTIQVQRLGRDASSRLLAYRFADGSRLLVGRDMHDVRELERMVIEALALGGGLVILLATAGALLFRAQLQRQLNAIHRVTTEVSGGRLDRRIAIGESRDEFARVAGDVNDMLDQIERLMDSARNVSNAIAHDLRTPLGRIRSSLEQALRSPHKEDRLTSGAEGAIAEIDNLITLLDKLLQIAEAESGVRLQSFAPVPMRELVEDMVDLYRPAAEARDIAIDAEVVGEPVAMADHHLVAGMLANLLDNALKYAGDGARVRVTAARDQDMVALSIRDDGPGMPEDALARATERFFRVDASRHRPGNGLGLSIVAAVVALHRGRLVLRNTSPGLEVCLLLPIANLSES